MKEEILDFGRLNFTINLPDYTDVLPMGKAAPFTEPKVKIRKAIKNPIDCLPLKDLVRQKLKVNPRAKAVVVISDETRPVPYSGESGILFPVVEEIINSGFPPSQILILVATGTHRPMRDDELRRILDPRIFELRIQILSHDCRNTKDLVSVGKTELGGEIFLNRYYVESDLKILTGLVESHFMAGVSGGRKSICPGLLSEDSIYILHSGPVLSSPKAKDLVLEGNPVHEEALKVAKMAGCDMIVNVTLDSNYNLTGVFAGSLETAHLAAFKKLQSYAAIPVKDKYDLVLTHTGYVGVNHYQAAKAVVAASPLIKENGMCILAAYHTEQDPIGGINYKKMIRLLGKKGRKKFLEMIMDPNWNFVPEQWEAQMWAKFFRKNPPENLFYCSMEIPREAFSWLPGIDARSIVPEAKSLQELVEKSLAWAEKKLRLRLGRNPRIAFLPDGPYGIPVDKNPKIS